MNASPSNAPTATLINREIYFRTHASRKDKIETPTNETRLTTSTLMNAYIYVMVMIFDNNSLYLVVPIGAG